MIKKWSEIFLQLKFAWSGWFQSSYNKLFFFHKKKSTTVDFGFSEMGFKIRFSFVDPNLFLIYSPLKIRSKAMWICSSESSDRKIIFRWKWKQKLVEGERSKFFKFYWDSRLKNSWQLGLSLVFSIGWSSLDIIISVPAWLWEIVLDKFTRIPGMK